MEKPSPVMAKSEEHVVSTPSPLPRSPEGLRTPRQWRRPGPLPLTPRVPLDLDRLRNGKFERGCMSERHLDAQGVLRLMRFAPTTLVPGAVFKILHAPTPNGAPPDLALDVEERVDFWRDSTSKWLRSCEEQGVTATSQEIEEWLARAEALLPADGGPDPDDPTLLPPELIASTKRKLAEKLESEKQEKKNQLERNVDRLYVVRDPQRTGRRMSGWSAEHGLRLQKYRFGDIKLDQMAPLHSATDFRKALTRKYENLLQAWDHLDTNGNGLLDFREFVAICRKLQIQGKLRDIFNELSSDKQNLRLTDLDRSMKDEEDRRMKLHEQHNVTRSTTRRQSNVLPVLQRLTQTANKSQQELFDQEAVRTMSNARLPPAMHRSSTHGIDGESHSSSPKRSNRGSVISTLGEVEFMLSNGPNTGAYDSCTSKDILHAIVRQYGSVEAGWNDLDRNADGVLCFQEFVMGCRKMQVRGNMRQMFNELCSDGGVNLKMTDVAPHMREEQERRTREAAERKRKNHAMIQEHEKEAQKLWRHHTTLSREHLVEGESPRPKRYASQKSLPAISNEDEAANTGRVEPGGTLE